MNRIAIIHMGAIGDLVQTFPAMRAIRRRWPEARITLVSRPERAVLAQMAGLADECLDYDVAPAAAEAELVVDFVGREPAAPPPQDRVVIHPHPLPPADWTEPAAAWIFRAVALPLDLPPSPLEPEIPVPPAVLDAARTALEKAGIRGPPVALHPGSGSVRKNWPLDRFVEIAARLRAAGRTVVWLSGPAERDRGTLGPAARAGAVLSDLPLDVLAGVLALADLYVGNDSGITQVAAAVRRPTGAAAPTVALFGPTDARVWAPRGRHVHVIRSESGAMEGIPTDRVWEAVVESLSG
jgi:ADP-heptose:LPS heptosyltransferase